MQRLVSAFVISRLNYCNSTLAGLSACALAPLQRVFHAVVLLVAGLGPRDHVRESMKDLHWLPIAHRIKFKLCTLYICVERFSVKLCTLYICVKRFSVRVCPTLDIFSFRFLRYKAVHVYVLLLNSMTLFYLNTSRSSCFRGGCPFGVEHGSVFQSTSDRFPTLDNLKER